MANMKYVQSVAERLNDIFMSEYPSNDSLNLDILELVEKLGGYVYEVGYLEANGNSMVINDSDDSFKIYVSATDGKNRQKFTIAHEIGHYFIHYKDGNPEERETVYRRTNHAYGGFTEYEANVFAASLLMPENKFKESFKSRGGDLGLIANDFGVSIAAAEVRARALGLLDNNG